MVKIIDKINAQTKEGRQFFSFEYFPPRTEDGVENLFERMERMVALNPVFCDITWGAGGSTADVTLDIATRMQTVICVETMMHLTCTNMQVEMLASALTKVRAAGLQNILALRGDPPKGQEKFEAVEGGLSCALDLVKYIRKEHGDYFGICVAGYPEAHPDTVIDGDDAHNEKSYWENIAYLKQKVEAGGELIITQLFYDCDKFLKFVSDCRSVGIEVPILPGIMPIMTYAGFKRMTGFCKTYVPQAIMDKVESIKDNEEAVKAYGIELGAEMCRRLLDSGVVPGVHLYSLNLERSAIGILERLGMANGSATAVVPRSLPWRQIPAGTSRKVEAVRPIFWSNRPKSYLTRTAAWGSYPTARWASDEVRAYGSLSANAFMHPHSGTPARNERSLAAWGAELKSVEDVKAVFAKYYKGEVACLPWSEHASEAGASGPHLVALAERGLLPINAQPALNAVASSDAAHGWGGPGGLVYQKAYVEFFASPEAFAALQPKLAAAPSLSYLAATAAGEVTGNLAAGAVNAVSWGVFPGKEVVQPSVVNAASFAAWKEEAFALWTSDWANIYEEGSTSRWLLQSIKDSWVLVAVVDDDFVAGDVFKALSA